MFPRIVALVALLLIPALASCSRTPGLFSTQNARAHIGMLAGTIGSRPVGTPANARARDYIVDQLRLFGFDVRVQEADARRAELGRTARVANIIAVKHGVRDEAVGLVSHYDSAPETPGAGDDAFGVAVSLEAARVLAARATRNWSLMVLVTDGEEADLMGAAALMTDREVTRRLQAYINVEAAGASPPVMLFEAGPANDWLLAPWARSTPHPRGASFGVEIYRRLPNDTDFSIIKRHDIPGLNFAAIGDSYAYHTARDTPERFSPRALRETGENVVALVAALDNFDIIQRTSWDATYVDIGGTVALAFGPMIGWTAAAVALAAGVIAWMRVTRAAIRLAGVARWLLTAIWTAIGTAIVFASMVGATWALRAAREVYHPWYARPDRLFLLMLAVGVTAGWTIARIGHWVPARAHGLRHPLMVWSMALPIWILLATGGQWRAPEAAYMWVLPLLTAGLLLTVVPVGHSLAVRAASVVVLAVAATLWLRNVVDLLRFMVPVFGRQAIVTPVFVYATLMAVAGIALVPPLVAAIAATRPVLRPSLITGVLLLGTAVSAAFAYAAPAYTYDQPLRCRVRALQPHGSGPAIWEIASVEPGLDLGPEAPEGWTPASGPPPKPWTPLSFPFVFRTSGPPLGPPPIAVAGFSVQPIVGGVELSLSAIPKEPGLTLAFVLPPGVTPARANLAGIERPGGWTAVYVAPPAEGVVFRASFRGISNDVLHGTRIVVTARRFPEGTGWQALPSWLPQDRAVWMAGAHWDVPAVAAPAIAPVPPLR